MMNNTAIELTEQRTRLIVWTLLCLFPIIGMSVDLVAPSLPAISIGLQVSTKIAKDVISIYLFGYAIGNFFTGFLTDALGRQKLICMGLLGFVIVSFMPVIFPHIGILLLARVLQGITIGVVAVTSKAIISDVLPPNKLIRLATLMGTMWGLGPVIGPVIGGYLQVYFGWKADFWFFALVTLLGLIATYIIVPETHFARHPLNFKTIKKNLIEVLSHRIFMAVVLIMGLSYSLIITFSTAGPFLIQKVLHHSPVFFGHLALTLGVVFLVSTFVCRYLLKYYEVDHLFFVGLHSFFAIAILAVIASYFFSQSLVLITIASAFMYFACGFIFPMSMGKGVSYFRHIAGTATATMYFINILLTSLAAFLVSFVNIQSTISIMWIYAVLLLLSVIVYWWGINGKKYET